MDDKIKTAREVSEAATAIILGKLYRTQQLEGCYKFINEIFDKINTLEHVSGYNIDILINKFAQGYTLSAPPTPLMSFREFEILSSNEPLIPSKAVVFRPNKESED
mgnify:CR=1 FL=1